MKKPKNNVLVFYSDLSPQNFIERANNIILNERYPYSSRSSKGFLFLIRTHHGGKEYFDCEVLPNDNGGTIIKGNLTCIPWQNREQTIAQKIYDGIITVIVCILLFPLVIFIGINRLILRLSNKKNFSPDEKKAIQFMTKTLGCTYKENNKEF